MLLTKAELGLAKLADKEEWRYTMNAIAVTPNETMVTNGHYAVRVKHDPLSDDNFPETPGLTHANPNGTPILIRREAALAALAAVPKKTTIPAIERVAIGEDGKLYVNTLDTVQSFKSETTGQFPNIDAVMPAGEPVATVTLAAKYVRLLADYMTAQGGRDRTIVKISFYGPDKPVKFESKTAAGQEVVTILMPWGN